MIEKPVKFKPWKVEDLSENLNVYKTHDFKNEEERKKYLFGEWVVQPLDAVVLYSKGNRSEIKHLFGDGNVHYINVKYTAVYDIVAGNRYKQVIIFDDGVKQEDIDVAMTYKWEK